jgi:Rod binding domain-containing protein
MNDLAITREGALNVPSNDPIAKLRQVANQFEAVFVQKLFQSLNESEEDEPPLIGGGHDEAQFKEMMQGAISEHIAGHLGIADTMVREMSKRESASITKGTHS